MTDSIFQIFECQNSDCRLRFPNNLSVETLEKCPFCGSPVLPAGDHFSNEKSSSLPVNRPTRHVSLLLDNLRSTFNVGSIFRTADGAGACHIYCCGTTPTPDHPKIIKTGLGAEWFVPWTYHRNSLDVIKKLEPSTSIFALEAVKGAVDLFEDLNHIESKNPVLLILGNEVSGIDPALMRTSNKVLSLPMLGGKSSLNVAVAAGIAIYALRFISEEKTYNE